MRGLLMGWMAFYIVFVTVGLIMEGSALTGTASGIGNIGEAVQFSIFKNPLDQVTWNPTSWFGATTGYLSAWANVLMLNDNPLFPAGTPMAYIRWLFLGVGGAPLMVELVSRALGRS
ncbi:MAG TPA: hypothetical protein VJA25_01365 [Dehalococcoidia bacterium]|nr:hypothetical protein [Dehalococcoidia bacterium]